MTNQAINYKVLYEECTRKLTEQTEVFQISISKAKSEYENLMQKYADLEEKSKQDYDALKLNYDNTECNISDHDSLSKDYEEQLRANDKELASLKEMIKRYNVSHNRMKKLNKEDTFSKKPMGRGSAKNVFNRCDNTSCDSVNVCEKCNDVQVGKVKAIMDKCSRLYFICKRCDDKNGDDGTLTPTSPTVDLEIYLTTIEERIDKTITKQLADNYKNIVLFRICFTYLTINYIAMC